MAEFITKSIVKGVVGFIAALLLTPIFVGVIFVWSAVGMFAWLEIPDPTTKQAIFFAFVAAMLST